MIAGQNNEPIPRRTLAEHYFENLHTAYRSMREAFAFRSSQGLTQTDLAARIDADEGLVSRWLKGKENMTLKTLSTIASGLGCGLVISFRPFETYQSKSNDWNLKAERVPEKPASAKLFDPNKRSFESALV